MSVHKVEKRFVSDYTFREGKRTLKLKMIGGAILFLFLLIINSVTDGKFPSTFILFVGTVYVLYRLVKAFSKISKAAKSTIFLVQEDKVAKIIFNKEIDFDVNSYADLSDYTNSILYHQTILTDNIAHTTVKEDEGIYIKSDTYYVNKPDAEIYIPIEVNDYKTLKAKILKRHAVYKVSGMVELPNYNPAAIATEPIKQETVVKETVPFTINDREPIKYKKSLITPNKKEESPKREPVYKKPEIKTKPEKNYKDFKHRYKTEDRKYH